MPTNAKKLLAGSIALGVLSLLQLWVVVAVMPPRGDFPLTEELQLFHLVFMSGASLVWLHTNLWLLRRGKFRWSVEGAITSIIWLIYLGITTPPLVYAR
jgi:hypothetical protein